MSQLVMVATESCAGFPKQSAGLLKIMPWFFGIGAVLVFLAFIDDLRAQKTRRAFWIRLLKGTAIGVPWTVGVVFFFSIARVSTCPDPAAHPVPSISTS